MVRAIALLALLDAARHGEYRATLSKAICLPMGWSTPSHTTRTTSRTMTVRRSSKRWAAS